MPSSATVEERRSSTWGHPAVAAAWTVAAAAALAGAALWPAAAGRHEVLQVGIRLAASLVVVALVAAAEISPLRRTTRVAVRVLGAAAFLSAFSYVNFGTFHHRSLVNDHEMFHYVLGARYFPELGYDGLYLASLEAEQELHPGRPEPRRMRDLRTNRLVPVRRLDDARRAVRARFRPARWRRFVRDHDSFARTLPPAWLARVRMDHGFNPTPAWTAVARLVSDPLPLGRPTLVALSLLDVALMVGAFVAIFRVFGARVGCLSLAVFGLGYGWRYYYIGGAFLRTDWLAAVAFAACLLERRRPGWAGAALGYATAVRIFPAILLLGPGVLALRAWSRGERPAWPWHLGIGFALVLAAGLAAGTLAGRGPSGWTAFSANILRHRDLAPPNRVGLDNVVRNAPTLLGDLARGELPRELPVWRQRQVERVREQRRVLAWAAQAGLLALVAGACTRARPAGSLALSTGAVFALAPAGSYYWAMLLLVPLQGGAGAVLGLLGLSTAMKAVHLAWQGDTTRYAIKSLGLLVFFVAWTAPPAWAALAARRPDRRPTRSAPRPGGDGTRAP